jgi:hypothetical protein
MTEELMTSRFGSHKSVCKPDQPDLGQVMAGRVEETGKVDQLRRNIYKVGSEFITNIYVTVRSLEIRYWTVGFINYSYACFQSF